MPNQFKFLHLLKFLLYISFFIVYSFANGNSAYFNYSYAENQQEELCSYVNILDFVSDEFIDDNQDNDPSKHLILCKVISNNQRTFSTLKNIQYSKTEIIYLFLLNQYIDLPPPNNFKSS